MLQWTVFLQSKDRSKISLTSLISSSPMTRASAASRISRQRSTDGLQKDQRSVRSTVCYRISHARYINLRLLPTVTFIHTFPQTSNISTQAPHYHNSFAYRTHSPRASSNSKYPLNLTTRLHSIHNYYGLLYATVSYILPYSPLTHVLLLSLSQVPPHSPSPSPPLPASSCAASP